MNAEASRIKNREHTLAVFCVNFFDVMQIGRKQHMPDDLIIRSIIHADGEICRASSSCHGAKLDVASIGTASLENELRWRCRECGSECERVMSKPEKVILRG